MVIGGQKGYIKTPEEGTEKDWINDIEVVSFDPANAAVPECLQNIKAFPATSFSWWVVRIQLQN